MKKVILAMLNSYQKGQIDIPTIQSKLNYFAENEVDDNERKQLIRQVDNQLEEVLFCYRPENQCKKVLEILTRLYNELE
ncbi:hypothetical protein [Clostridium sp. AN503]|uniref:hypothetical protein n=1 Tax=Clostridium sp. AN503 TaxID=3160598 RepID=UPI0034587FEE